MKHRCKNGSAYGQKGRATRAAKLALLHARQATGKHSYNGYPHKNLFGDVRETGREPMHGDFSDSLNAMFPRELLDRVCHTPAADIPAMLTVEDIPPPALPPEVWPIHPQAFEDAEKVRDSFPPSPKTGTQKCDYCGKTVPEGAGLQIGHPDGEKFTCYGCTAKPLGPKAGTIEMVNGSKIHAVPTGRHRALPAALNPVFARPHGAMAFLAAAAMIAGAGMPFGGAVPTRQATGREVEPSDEE